MKRSEPMRRTPLRPSPNPSLRAKTHSPEKRAWARLRKSVYERDAASCVVCGIWLVPGRWEAHHRRFKSAGGKNVKHNILACCFDCHHNVIHCGDRAVAEAKGWVVPSHKEPSEVPVTYHDGRTVLLSNEANKEAA